MASPILKFDEFRSRWITIPGFVPNVAADVATSDVYAVHIHLINNTGNPVTVTIADKQTSPMAVIPTSVSIPANGDAIWTFHRFCPGGITWSAGSANAIVGYIEFEA